MMVSNIHAQLDKVNEAFNHKTVASGAVAPNAASFQLITYGAPGTGKSHKTKEDTDKWKANVFRTTFHPDSDYSTFVGAYKPSMSDDAGRVEVYNGSGASKVLDATHEVKKGISYCRVDFKSGIFVESKSGMIGTISATLFLQL